MERAQDRFEALIATSEEHHIGHVDGRASSMPKREKTTGQHLCAR